MLAPGGSCVEITQSYQRVDGGATTGKYFGIWDWCQSPPEGQFDVYEPQVTTWQNRCVRTYQGKPMYTVSIVTPNTGSTMGQCWYAHLYDYLLGGWVQRARPLRVSLQRVDGHRLDDVGIVVPNQHLDVPHVTEHSITRHYAVRSVNKRVDSIHELAVGLLVIHARGLLSERCIHSCVSSPGPSGQ